MAHNGTLWHTRKRCYLSGAARTMKFVTATMIASTLLSATLGAPPATDRKPVTDTYHGDSVADDYRWLEDAKSKEVQQWSDAQNAYARAYLDKLPGRDK